MRPEFTLHQEASTCRTPSSSGDSGRQAYVERLYPERDRVGDRRGLVGPFDGVSDTDGYLITEEPHDRNGLPASPVRVDIRHAGRDRVRRGLHGLGVSIPVQRVSLREQTGPLGVRLAIVESLIVGKRLRGRRT